MVQYLCVRLEFTPDQQLEGVEMNGVFFWRGSKIKICSQRPIKGSRMKIN